MSLTDTPNANRLHIALFGRRNSGKSSLINALTNQNAALVSDIAGTTTDPVYQPMESHGNSWDTTVLVYRYTGIRR